MAEMGPPRTARRGRSKVEGIEDVELQRRGVTTPEAKIESDPLALHGLEKRREDYTRGSARPFRDVHRRREQLLSGDECHIGMG